MIVTFTVNDRPNYLRSTLDSWASVRGIGESYFLFNCEPNESNSAQIAHDWICDNSLTGEVVVNEVKQGVLSNPHTALKRAFQRDSYAILAEDDLLVSSDILEYHRWASAKYVDDPEIAMICSFSNWDANVILLPNVLRVPGFGNVKIWGTWKDRWEEYISPTWDHDYSSSSGYDSGWDWNLNRRVLPKRGKKSIVPMLSRVQNIGAVGTHADTGEYEKAPVFELDRPKVDYLELGV